MSEPTIWDDQDLDAAAETLRRPVEAFTHRRGTGLKTLLILAVADDGLVSMNFEGCTCPRCCGEILTHIAEKAFGATTEVSEVMGDETHSGPQVH